MAKFPASLQHHGNNMLMMATMLVHLQHLQRKRRMMALHIMCCQATPCVKTEIQANHNLYIYRYDNVAGGHTRILQLKMPQLDNYGVKNLPQSNRYFTLRSCIPACQS